MASMNKLSKEITKALQTMGYNPLNEVQKRIVPELLEYQNVVVQATTGTGKTAAYAIPLCEHIVFEQVEPQVLVLTCTRELSVQAKEEFSRIGKFKRIKALAIYGKASMKRQKSAIKQGYHVICATPGRLLDHLLQGNINLSSIRYVVIDEVDYMFDLGFYEQVKSILSYIPKEAKKAFFSATYNEEMQTLIDTHCEQYERISVMKDLKITHEYVLCEDLYEALHHTIVHCEGESVIVFCERKEDIVELSSYLFNHRLKHVTFHGDLLQKHRFENLEAFKKGSVRVLLASDVAARGIDIQRVSHVIHFEAPSNEASYIHRSGRSGRVEEVGNSIVVSQSLDFMNKLTYDWKEFKAKNHTNMNVHILKEDKDEAFSSSVEKLYINAGKEKKVRTLDIIGAFCSIDGITHADIGVVEVLDKMSYVEVFHGKAQIIIKAMKNKTIKKKVVKIQIAK